MVATVSGPDVGTVTEALWLGVLPAPRVGAAAAAGVAVSDPDGAQAPPSWRQPPR